MKWIIVVFIWILLFSLLKLTENYDITPEQRALDLQHCIVHKYPWEIKPNCDSVDINNNCVKCIWERDGVAVGDQYFVGINSVTDKSAGCKFNNKNVSGNYPVWRSITGDATSCVKPSNVTTTNTSIVNLASNSSVSSSVYLPEYQYTMTFVTNTCQIPYTTVNSLVDSQAVTTISGSVPQTLEWKKVQKIDAQTEPPKGGITYTV
jgi:hypothetical protein